MKGKELGDNEQIIYIYLHKSQWHYMVERQMKAHGTISHRVSMPSRQLIQFDWVRFKLGLCYRVKAR